MVLAQPPKRLLDQLRDTLQTQHFAIRAEKAYVDWVRRFILFHHKRHPKDMGVPEVEAFLTPLALARNVFRLQQRIYRAARRGDGKRVHALQRLLLRSWSARCLAVRQVTQDNRGKRTPGGDGVASLTPEERLRLAHQLRQLNRWTIDPIQRFTTGHFSSDG